MRNLSSQLYRFLIRQVRQAMRSKDERSRYEVDKRREDEQSIKRNLTRRKLKKTLENGEFFFFETESLEGPRLEGKGI